MTVRQIIEIKGITECTLNLVDLAEGKEIRPYSVYTSLMDEQELNATVSKVEEWYNGFWVVDYAIKAYIG